VNTDKRNHNKIGIRLYIIIILCVLIAFVIVFKRQVNLKDKPVSSSFESFKLENTDIIHDNNSFLDNLLNIRLNITEAILSHEITWLKYFDKTTVTTVAKDGKPSISGFNLNTDDLIKGNSTIATSQGDTEVYDASLKQQLDINNPQVYVYHTHTTESYFDVADPSMGVTKADNTPTDSEEKSHNMSGLGQMLCDIIGNDYGIATTHDDLIHNEPYIGAYADSRVTLEEALAKYPNYKLIIDMHRDSVEASKKDAVTATINGESVAKLMFVIDLSHDGVEKNEQTAKDLIDIANRLFPGLIRETNGSGIFIYPGIYTYNNGSGHFNQDLSGNLVEVEVGADCNTYEEAQNSQKYLARVIAEYLKDK